MDVLVDDLADREIGVIADEATYTMIDTGVPISPLPMSTAHLEQLRRGERLLAKDLDAEGIAL